MTQSEISHSAIPSPSDAVASCVMEPPSRAHYGFAEDADFWVFGYGSLMWDPGFPVAERQTALLYGYHRSFCILSHRYRGTIARPGLVLGLNHGGACRGMALRVAAVDAAGTWAYLWHREMITCVYRPRRLRVRLSDQAIQACVFVADPHHPQYSGGLDQDTTAAIIRRASGERGPNIDYLIQTVEHLRSLGIRDHALERLLLQVTPSGAAVRTNLL